MLSVKMRVTMCSRAIIFLIGAVYICHQVLATDGVFIAELMVESNVTLEAQTVLTALNTTNGIKVIDKDGGSHDVTFLQHGLIADCLIVGDETTCTCAAGYIWSNEVCYLYGCCRETPCKHNVSLIIPLCVAKIKVDISGTITLTGLAWDSAKTTQLVSAFGKLNGFEGLNVTAQREDNKIVEFEGAVSVRLNTSRLQEIVDDLQTSLSGVLEVDTAGMVTIEAPETTVCYESTPVLNCSFEEVTDSAGWSMSNPYQRFELNTGSVVELIPDCVTEEYKSCIGVKLNKVTEIWSGKYECGFTRGSVTHKAKTSLSVALLPDVITLKINPLTGDCSQGAVTVDVTATILNSSENFEVWWSYRSERQSDLTNKSEGNYLIYKFSAPIDCEQTKEAQTITVYFKNMKGQEKTASVDVPVIYKGAEFCPEDVLDGYIWPKTPGGDTVINRTCPEGRVGYNSRTCEGKTWQLVYHSCINEELNEVVNAADNFRKGLGATQKVAETIFEGLKNNSLQDSDASESIADISATIGVLGVMAQASGNVVLQDDVIPNFADAASNMLNKTWEGVNKSTVETMSSDYLKSVEGLVKNIRINSSKWNTGFPKAKLDLKVCSSSECNVSVFGSDVKLNMTGGIMKTVALKNLTDKLKNNFGHTEVSSLTISVTRENNNDSTLIRLGFPKEQLNHTKPSCVFWNIRRNEWSDEGCNVTTNDDNNTVCVCDHLTSFAVLFAKSDVSTDVLDMITHVGLGVSICSLLIFLVIESLVWSAVVKSNLSHFRHTALVNIAVFLLLADCSFLASTSPETLSNTMCLVLTVCKHLFFLAMFSWMLCMSVMLVHQLIFVFSPLRKRVFMFLSSIVGYVCPILIVGSSYVYCKYTHTEYFNPDTCWLCYEGLLKGSAHAFILPVGTVILTNLFSMVVVILTLTKSSVPDGSKADDKETAKSILKVVVFLTPVFGVTWIIGFALFIIDESTVMFQVALYSFTILNSFQGLLILITGSIAEVKVREELLKLIMAKSKRGKSESMKNLTSTTYTKDK